MTARALVSGCILLCACRGAALAQQPQHPQAVVVAPAPAKATVGKIEVSSQADSLTITIAVSSSVTPTASLIQNPDRLVLDFPGCEIKDDNQRIPVDHGLVKDLRVSQFREHPRAARVVVDLSSPSDFRVRPWANGNIVVEIPISRAQAAIADSVRDAAIVQKESSAATAQIPGQHTSAAAKAEAAQPTAVQPETAAANAGNAQPPVSQAAPPASPSRAVAPQTTAYDLMTKAKALTVADLQTLEQKAAADDPEAQTLLALAYHAGVLLKQDDAQAISLLHKAADRGYMAAEESLGIFAETGVGMSQPAPAEALQWYEKAARQGSNDAATNIALMYANGKGVGKDAAQAVNWFQHAAEGGEASAQYNLALMYARGEGVPKDYHEAIRWLTAAADQNVVPAMLDLAEFSMRPPDPTLTQDVAKAVKYYEKAADAGNVLAQVNLASIYSKGFEGKPDYAQAVMWYRKAAEQGDRDGQFGLAVCYALGRGVPVDYEEARRWFTSAADQGQVQAQFDLGVIYEEGQGVPADRDVAAHYYELAAEKGMGKAQYRYGVLLARTKESRTDRVAAYKWLMLAQDSIKESSPVLSDVRKSMSEPEIAEAEREIDSWRLAHRPVSH